MSFLLYVPFLLRRRLSADSACVFFNTSWLSRSHRHRILRRAFPGVHAKSNIARPFNAGQAGNFEFGFGSFMNVGCIVLNGANVRIGAHVLVGPAVTFCADTHHADPGLRKSSPQALSKPIVVGDYAWIGAGAVICPGVEIGEHAVIAAGSVVTRNVPPYSLAAGTPAIIKRQWNADDASASDTASQLPS